MKYGKGTELSIDIILQKARSLSTNQYSIALAKCWCLHTRKQFRKYVNSKQACERIQSQIFEAASRDAVQCFKKKKEIVKASTEKVAATLLPKPFLEKCHFVEKWHFVEKCSKNIEFGTTLRRKKD